MSTIGPFDPSEYGYDCRRPKPHNGACNGNQTPKCAPRERDPNGLDAKTPGAKLDAGKSPVRRGLLEYFPRSCMAVANLSARGAGRYSWGGWKKVENGIDRYGDGQIRHILKAAIEGPVDKDWDESEETLHATAEAWNALARLELILIARETTK